jgi:hypothetical protein
VVLAALLATAVAVTRRLRTARRASTA